MRGCELVCTTVV